MNTNTDSVATVQCNNTKDYLLPGNIIPHIWYYRFTYKGHPDLVAITILADILAWWRNSGKINSSDFFSVPYFNGISLALSYDYFCDRFRIHKETARRALVRLEQAEVLTRKVSNVELGDGSRVNRLFIILDQKFLANCFRSPELDIRVEDDTSTTNSSNISDSNDPSSTTEATTPDSGIPTSLGGEVESEAQNTNVPANPSSKRSPIICGDHIKNNNFYNDNYNKNRYLSSAEDKSDFLNKFNSDFLDFSNNSSSTNSSVDLRAPKAMSEASFESKAPALAVLKHLANFYPLSEEDASKLRRMSGRNFNLRAMNEILLDMSGRLRNKWFKGKKSFLNYMSLVFENEKRDAYKISNDTFRIKNNLKIEDETIREQIKSEKEEAKQEKYLTAIEYNLEVSPEWHFRKKIAARLERSKAYNFLRAFEKIEFMGNNESTEKLVCVVRIHLSKYVGLSQEDKKIIFDDLKASHERLNLAEGECRLIGEMDIIMPKENKKGEKGSAAAGERKKDTLLEPRVLNWNKDRVRELEGEKTWAGIRMKLIAKYGKDLHKSWFSKLAASLEEDKENKKKRIKLVAPSKFIRDWIKDNYASEIVSLLKEENYELTGIENSDQLKAAEEMKETKAIGELKEPEGIWTKVRQLLRVRYGEGTDKSWFSKLEAREDKEKQTLELKAPNGFVKDWIQRDYGGEIERLLILENYKCAIC